MSNIGEYRVTYTTPGDRKWGVPNEGRFVVLSAANITLAIAEAKALANESENEQVFIIERKDTNTGRHKHLPAYPFGGGTSPRGLRQNNCGDCHESIIVTWRNSITDGKWTLDPHRNYAYAY